MISKERLEELIEQEATIWSDNHCPINLINDGKHKIKLLANALYVAEEFENCAHTHTWWDDYTIGFDDLYENEEDSMWAEEFGCIERTERLELPTWEELQNKKEHYISFTTKRWTKCWLAIDMPYRNDFGKILITYADSDNNYHIFYDKRLTKENYTLACRKAKELFLGAENE